MKKFGNRLVLLATVLISAAIYATMWRVGPLNWDDTSNIFVNPYFVLNKWWGIWLAPYYGLYVPVVSSAWAFLFYLGGGEAWPFRLFNLVVHSANIVLVYIVLMGLAKRWQIRAPFVVGLAVTVFALHPLQVESVAWISGGRDLLSTFFALLAVIFYFGYPTGRGFAAASVAFALALLSKPSVAILPIVFMFMDWAVMKRPFKLSLKYMGPWIILSLIAIYLTRSAQVEYFVDQEVWWQRPLVMLDTYVFYLAKMLWPFSLSGNYGRTPEFILVNPGVLGLSATGFVLAFGILAWTWPRDRRIAAFAAVWALLLLPVSGIVPFGYQDISQVADHYNYLPLVAIAVVVMIVLNKIAERERWLLLIPAVLALVWATLSYARTKVWENDYAFFSDMAQSAPESYSTAIGMSVALCAQRGDYEGGLQWVDKALAAKRYDIVGLSNQAYCLIHAGRYHDVVKAMEILERVDRKDLARNQPTAYSSWIASIGTALIEQKQFENGYRFLCEAYRVKPSESTHTQNLKAGADILRQHGLNPDCGPVEN